MTDGTGEQAYGVSGPGRHVLHVMRVSGVSGAENHLLELVRDLRSTGWRSDVLIVSPEPGGLAPFMADLRRVGERVWLRRMERDLDPRLVARLAVLLRGGRYALAHSHLLHADWHLAAASATAAVPIVSSKHNHDPFRLRRGVREVERWAVGRCAAVIAISGSLADFTEEVTGRRPDTVLYGLDPGPEPPPRTAGSTLLAVGRLTPQKGYDVMLDAMAAIARSAPGVRLEIAGDGPQRREIEARVERLGLHDHVRLLGRVEDVGRRMEQADLLVHTARWEGFGLVLLEAMRARLPVVATAVSAIPEVVADGETGLLVPPGDAGAVASAVLELLHDPRRREAMGTAARERLERRFAPARMARETAAVYERALRR